MNNHDERRLPALLATCVAYTICSVATSMVLGCSKPSTPPPATTPQDQQEPPLGGSGFQPTNGAPPRLVIGPQGALLNDELISLENAVERIREFCRSRAAPGGDDTFTLVVTIEPDVRFKDEKAARAALSDLEQGPHPCQLRFETPPAPGGRFPAKEN